MGKKGLVAGRLGGWNEIAVRLGWSGRRLRVDDGICRAGWDHVLSDESE